MKNPLQPAFLKISVLFMSAQLCKSQSLLSPESVVTDASLNLDTYVNPLYGVQTFGNNVCNRSTPTESFKFRTWVDISVSLPAGSLHNFYLFGHPQNESNLARIQIWRPVNENELRLVWERRIHFNQSSTGSMYTYNVVEDNFHVQDGDHIGWTYEGDYSRLAFDFSASSSLRVANIGLDNLTIGSSYVFDNTRFPMTVSVAVDIDLKRCSSCPAFEYSCEVAGSPCTSLADVCQTIQDCRRVVNETNCGLRVSGASDPKQAMAIYSNETIIKPFNRQGDDSLYGRNVTASGEPLLAGTGIAGAGIIFIGGGDLPDGILLDLYVYVNASSAGQTLDYASSFVRLQVWRPYDVERDNSWWQLVCQLRVQIANETGTHWFSLNDTNDVCLTRRGDRLGFTAEGNVVPISYSLTQLPDRGVSRLTWPPTGSASVGLLSIVKLDSLVLPYEFSFAAQIDRNPCNLAVYRRSTSSTKTTIITSTVQQPSAAVSLSKSSSAGSNSSNFISSSSSSAPAAVSPSSTSTLTPVNVTEQRSTGDSSSSPSSSIQNTTTATAGSIASTTSLPSTPELRTASVTSESTTSSATASVTAEVKIVGVRPTFGPLAGGTKITLSGQSLNVSTAADVSILLVASVGTRLSAHVLVDQSSSSRLVAVTPPFNESNTPLAIVVLFNGGRPAVSLPLYFTYRPNPNVTDIFPRDHLTSGGTVVSIVGENVDSAQFPVMSLTVVVSRQDGSQTVMQAIQLCNVTDGYHTSMTCLMPPLNLPKEFHIDDASRNRRSSPLQQSLPTNGSVATMYSSDRLDRADIIIGLLFDGFSDFNNLRLVLPNTTFVFFPPPVIEQLASVINFDPQSKDTISIKGQNMTRGCRLIDYRATVGAAQCDNVQLTDNNLVCRPPGERPEQQSGGNTSCPTNLAVNIVVGFRSYHYACLDYKSPAHTGHRNLLFLLLLLLLLLLVVVPIGAFFIRRHYEPLESTGRRVSIRYSTSGDKAVAGYSQHVDFVDGDDEQHRHSADDQEDC